MSISATLPGELLSMIFAHATRPRGEGAAPRLSPCASDEEFDAVSLFNITHVCRFWRVVALADRALWTDIHSHCLSQAQQDAFLQRSRDQPVSLCSRADFSDFADVVNSLPAARLRRLKLVLNSHPRDIAPLMLLHAPILECLTFVSGNDELPVDLLLQRPQLLSSEVVYLKALALHAIGWVPSNHFPALTHLYLSVLPNQKERLSAGEILSLLSHTPQLEFVHLRGVESDLTHGRSYTSLPFALPRLRSLTCNHWAHGQVVKLLSHIMLPRRCRVRLSNIINESYVVGYPAPLPQLAPLRGTTHLELASSPTHLLLVCDGGPSGVWLETTMYGGHNWNSWLAGLHAVLPLSNITSLHINIHRKHTFWPSLLPHMLQLTRLDVIVGSSEVGHRRPIDMLCDLLTSSGTSALAPAPALRKLRLQFVESVRRNQSPASSLRRMLEHRARAGCQLHRLSIQLNAETWSIELAEEVGQKLVAALSEHVRVLRVRVVDPSEEPLCQFKMRDGWNVAGAELYWTLDAWERPQYVLWQVSREW
ncbi:hypothetical protein OH76DRAFT_1561754 [Lentinus brumalis]|uniref:Uncharacterized protein n=1 Tax=Lentinus brumalis TaxID=2498619 RepID=A0A371CLF4_9APHY|nr:hypothetical protein OH76DRAFT_1561754 [Polyporus brumalis]